MSYADVRSRIATVLATVAITSPIEETIQRVYTEPPEQPQDLPCFIMYGPKTETMWAFGGHAVGERATEMVRLLVKDANLDRAAAIVNAYRAALLTAFQAEGGLNNKGVIGELTWDDPAGFKYANGDYTGQDFYFTCSPKAL